MSSRRYLGIIPARGGSRRAPGKNLHPLGGKPLLAYTIEAAQGAHGLCDVVVSTDSPEIARYASSCGIDTQGFRPAELAHDDSPVIETVQHALAQYEASRPAVDAVVLLQPTSPFRSAAHIDGAIARFEQTAANTVVTVRRAKEHPYWAWKDSADGIEPFFSLVEMALDRSALPDAYVENGAVFVIERSLVVEQKIYGGKIIPYVMDELASIDIDTPEDVLWAEFLLRHSGGGAKLD